MEEQYGMKVLGVYMGSPKFVHNNNLRAKLQRLSEEKDIIISFPDKQVPIRVWQQVRFTSIHDHMLLIVQLLPMQLLFFKLLTQIWIL